MHQLLPWYVNKTLGSSEAEAFEAHLAVCEACRKDMNILEKVRAQLTVHGEAVLSDHPDPEELVAVVTGATEDLDLQPNRTEEIRRHVALCTSCADEAGWARHEAPAGSPAGAPAAVPVSGWRWVLPWLLPVAATLAVLLVPPFLDRSGGEALPSGIVLPHLIESTQRGEEAPTVLGVDAEADPIHLIFPVDANAAAFPLQLQIVDGDSAIVFRTDSVGADDLYRGLFVFVRMNRNDCPDGRYLGRLVAADGTVVTYPFRVTTDTR